MANGIADEMFKRMVLANQYRMLALLDEGNEAFWERAADVAEEGWPAESLPGFATIEEYSREPLTREDQEFVVDIFQIHQLLQDAADAGMVPADGLGTDFPGFDGNYETRLMGYARHLVEHEQRFVSVRAWDGYNSHMPTVDAYLRMLAAWHRHGKPLRLSRRQFDEIIAQRSGRFEERTAASAQ